MRYIIDKLGRLIIVTWFILATFLPSKYVAEIVTLNFILIFFSMIIFGINIKRFMISLIILFLLCLFTITYTNGVIRWGNVISFINSTMVFCLNFERINLSLFEKKIVDIVIIILIIIGFGILIKNEIIISFLMKNYQTYNNLHYAIVFKNKPVLVYDMHSLAAIFIFMFICIYYCKNIYKRNIKDIVILILLIIMYINLRSNTSLMIVFILIFMFVIKQSLDLLKKRIKLSGVLILIVITIFIIVNLNNIIDIFLSERNGFLGRFSENGILIENVKHILNNIFIGSGFSQNANLFLGDSGMIQIISRITIFGAILYYINILKFGIEIDKKFGFIIVLIICLSEIGVNIITYYRFIPTLIIVLGYISSLRFEKINN